MAGAGAMDGGRDGEEAAMGRAEIGAESGAGYAEVAGFAADEDELLREERKAQEDAGGLWKDGMLQPRRGTGRVAALACVALMAVAVIVIAGKTRQDAGQVVALAPEEDSEQGPEAPAGPATDAAGDAQVPPQALEYWGQSRPAKWQGVSESFVDMNTHADIVKRRVRSMEAVDEVKNGPCAGFDAFQQGGFKSNGGPWLMFNGATKGGYAPDGITYRDSKQTYFKMKRSVCHAPHPHREKVTVTIERLGPFRSFGGYDWSLSRVQKVKNVGNLASELLGRNASLVGGMAVPVTANGTIIGYPPLHIHHAHVYPYGDRKERRRKIHGSRSDNHDIVIQNHGDSECQPEEGGTACLLKELEEGEGYHMFEPETGLVADFEVNDARPANSSGLVWFFEIVILHKLEDMPEKRVTFLGLNNPCWGTGPCTYQIPYDESSTAMWFEYQHKYLGPGHLKNWIVHTHQTLFDSMFVFKGAGVFAAFEQFRGTGFLPLVLECHNSHTLDSAKASLIEMAMAAGGELACEVTKPSLAFRCAEGGAEPCHAYDKRARLNCVESLRMEPGDRLTVLAFNHIRPHPDVGRASQAFNRTNVYSRFYAAYQHSIVRADFVTDDGFDYAPPSFFHYGKLSTRSRADRPDASVTRDCIAQKKGIMYSFDPSRPAVDDSWSMSAPPRPPSGSGSGSGSGP